MTKKILVLGGGAKGLMIAHYLSKNSDHEIHLIAKDNPNTRDGMSGYATGLAHSGIYYETLPASDKVREEKNSLHLRAAKGLMVKYGFERARQTVIAAGALKEYANGKLVICYKDEHKELLKEYKRRAVEHGRDPEKIRLFLTPESIKKNVPNIEPLVNPNIKGAMHIQQTFMFRALDLLKYLNQAFAKQANTSTTHNQTVIDTIYDTSNKKWKVITKDNTNKKIIHEADFIINATGRHVDKIHGMMEGKTSFFTTASIGGMYIDYDGYTDKKINTAIYTVPKDPTLPFLDPHTMPDSTNGGFYFGPNAVWYPFRDPRTAKLSTKIIDTISYFCGKNAQNNWHMLAKNWRGFLAEWRHFWNKKKYAASCQQMLDENQIQLDPTKLKLRHMGVRGQMVLDGKVLKNLCDVVTYKDGKPVGLTIANATSPGWTVSAATAEYQSEFIFSTLDTSYQTQSEIIQEINQTYSIDIINKMMTGTGVIHMY
jgi:L-2-hydroxyglutarate oxidase LhgO